MPLLLLSPRLPANRLAYAALALSLSLFATVAPAPVAAQGLPDFTDLVEKVGPAVVNIRTTERGRIGARRLRQRAGRGDGGAVPSLFRRSSRAEPAQPAQPAAAA